MFNVKLAGDHLYGKWLFTWPPLMMSLVVTKFVLSFPTGCLGWDLELNLCEALRIFRTTFYNFGAMFPEI